MAISNNNNNDESIKFICPSIDELKVIVNHIRCEECNLVFCNKPRFRMHDLKVHKHQNLDKSFKGNVRYHCPVNNCIYAPNNKKHFALYKYLKQHYLKVHAEKIFTCTQCTKRFSTNSAKNAHMRVCGTVFKCMCQKSFNSYEALLTHAKRNFHKVDEKYKSKQSNNKIIKQINLSPVMYFETSNNETLKFTNKIEAINILPKSTCDAAIQTVSLSIKKKSSTYKNKGQICKQTQTSDSFKEKQFKKSAATQTTKTIPRVIRVHQIGKHKKISVDKNTVTKGDISLVETLSSECQLPISPLSLRHDIILQDLWEEKSSLGTQTSPEKYIFNDLDDYITQNVAYQGIFRSDPMLTEDIFANKFSSIETQTEKAYCQSIFESDPLSSNNETQTTENFTETMEPLHIYSNTCTQTCDEILSSDLGLSDIQTQTAWNHLDESTVSTETQTRTLKCLSGCNDTNSWFTIQTNHMETQTDLLHIFEDLE
ncbi:PREDICTED: zinc finger protein JACKDAW [Ceratosolen solmsi marchali]|uniref:Zinc finger protein JACKDAW n=1 Tax=Ceratosolen solmsi marchali TaxID=326594 RepID=A0AAJ7DZ07_9HYME|nr:PREDICTED: zinc finger protein JACKDAW [Ceratosolen solmsi marchali]